MTVDSSPSQQTPTTSILPGATIGMVGGGQLGKMFAQAATSMGYEVVIFCESHDEPAAQVTRRSVIGPLHDPASVNEFASQCDVITLEFENIPADTIALCATHAPTYPKASVLATAQDRLIEKGTLKQSGLPVTPYVEVSGSESLAAAGQQLGWPMIVKTARSGYDGKGQYRAASIADAERIDWNDCQQWIAEKCISFQREVSVVVARTPQGDVSAFPVFENTHRNHILDVSVAPAQVSPEIASRARQIAERAAEALDVVGLLCVELFHCGDEVMINEVAPRPHNSGHLTIEGCHTSQFEQHVRAICNLPLGSTELRAGAAAMANLLGDLWTDGNPPDWQRALEVDGISLHLYGKRFAKPGRKMGHLTTTGKQPEDVISQVEQARAKLSLES